MDFVQGAVDINFKGVTGASSSVSKKPCSTFVIETPTMPKTLVTCVCQVTTLFCGCSTLETRQLKSNTMMMQGASVATSLASRTYLKDCFPNRLFLVLCDVPRFTQILDVHSGANHWCPRG